MTSRLLLFACVALTACGVKGRLRAPEDVHPRAPTRLLAQSTAAGVRLTWNRPVRYGGGLRMDDLGGFDVERAAGEGGAFARVARIELTDQGRFRKERKQEWTDLNVTPGATYRYRVIAFTLDGYESDPAGPVTVEHRRPD
jgi:predicted small lipoprotein YifL